EKESGNAGYSNENGEETVPAYNCTEGCAVATLDAQSGNSGSGTGKQKISTGKKRGTGSWTQNAGMQRPGQENTGVRDFGDTGGASRFFYVAKASKKDKGPDNTHPTVKSTVLMENLIRLVTPPGGTVLDPFA